MADLWSLGVVIVTSLVCVPLGGLLGAATATLAGTSTDVAVRLFILARSMRESWKEPAHDSRVLAIPNVYASAAAF